VIDALRVLPLSYDVDDENDVYGDVNLIFLILVLLLLVVFLLPLLLVLLLLLNYVFLI